LVGRFWAELMLDSGSAAAGAVPRRGGLPGFRDAPRAAPLISFFSGRKHVDPSTSDHSPPATEKQQARTCARRPTRTYAGNLALVRAGERIHAHTARRGKARQGKARQHPHPARPCHAMPFGGRAAARERCYRRRRALRCAAVRAQPHQHALHARHARQAVCHKGKRPVEGYLLLTPPQPPPASPQLAKRLSRSRTGRYRRVASRTHTRVASSKQWALSSRKTKSLPKGGLPPPRPTPRLPPVQPSRTSPAMIAPLRAQKTRPGDSGTAAEQTQQKEAHRVLAEKRHVLVLCV